MRLLFVLPFLPDPRAPHGGGAYLGHLLGALAGTAELGVIALLPEEEMGRWQSSRTTWAWQHAEVRTATGRGLHYLPRRLQLLWRWRREPLVAAKHWHPGLVHGLVRAQREFQPQAVLFELAQMAQYLPHVRGVPTVLTDHEAGTPANTTTGLGPFGDRRDRRLWHCYVRRFYPRADLLQAVTAEDAEQLQRTLQRPVLVRPPTIEGPATPVAPGATKPAALFFGDYHHQPNVEAASRLARDVLPILRRRQPAAELLLAGTASERIRDLGDLPGVRVLGFQPDLGSLLGQARLLLAPVWSGAGFRMKSLTALAHGLPVVTNALGARGLDAPKTARLVADDVESLAAAAATWLDEPAAAATAGKAAFDWVRDTLSPHRVAALQIERVQALLQARGGSGS